ncbi:MAG: serine hydrolase [Flavobacteriales bacterium]|nr:serine hydrolase [Flavobacteriales bacterium]
MRKILLVIILAFIISPYKLISQNINIEKLDQYIENARLEWGIPGMAVAIVKDGKVILSKGYGLRNIKSGKKVDKNTLFAIASNSKAFTTAALSILVDEQKINWDDKVIDYLPWFKLYSPYVTENITIRDLVSHRSGLNTFSGDLLWYYTNYSTEEVVRRAQFLEPKYGFRENFGYQNIMFSAAGLILEKVSGTTWREFIESKFMKPLNMTNSNTSVTALDLKANTAIPYHVGIDRKPVAINYLNWDNCEAAAAINSSVEDMSKWLIFQLDNGKLNGKQIISEEQIWEVRKLTTPTPVSKTAFNGNPNTHYKGYGLGWNIYDYNGKKVINHGGGSDGMISKVAMIPEENLGLVILTNDINYLPSALTYQIFDMYFANDDKDWSKKYLSYYKSGLEKDAKRSVEMEELRVKNTKPSFKLSEYTGKYTDITYGSILVEEKNGKLILKYLPTDGLIGDLNHYHFDVFTIKIRDLPSLPSGTVQFKMNAKGIVNSVKVDIPNPDFYFDEYNFIKE